MQAIFAGYWHSAVLDASGLVFLFGSDSHGQLGAGEVSSRSASHVLLLLKSIDGPVRFSSVVLGQQHTVVFAVNASNSSQGITVWAFGSNEYGQLGSKDSQLPNHVNPMPRHVQAGTNRSWETGCAGNSHTILLDDQKRLWAAGSNYYGQAGVSCKGGGVSMCSKLFNLKQVGYLLGIFFDAIATYGDQPFILQKVRRFACGGDHNLVLTEDGNLWSFGINEYGELIRPENLGSGNPNPTPIMVPDTVLNEDAGGNFEVIVGIWAAGSNSIIQTARQLCFPV